MPLSHRKMKIAFYSFLHRLSDGVLQKVLTLTLTLRVNANSNPVTLTIPYTQLTVRCAVRPAQHTHARVRTPGALVPGSVRVPVCTEKVADGTGT